MKTLIKGFVIAGVALSANVALADQHNKKSGEKAKVETSSSFERKRTFSLRRKPIDDAGVERLIRSARSAGN